MSTLLAQMNSCRRVIAAVALPLAALTGLSLTALSVAGCRASSDAAAPAATTATATASPSPTASSFTDRPADDIRDAAVINLAMATSVHVRGYLTTSSGKKENIDLLLSRHDGHIIMTDNAGPLEIVRIGDFLYVKGTREYWRPSGDAAVKLMDGKYLKAPTSDQHFASFNGFFDVNRFMPTQHLTKGPVGEVNGTSAIALVDSDPQQGGTLYVAAQGTPYPLRIQSASGALSLDFSDYNVAVQIAAPPSSKTVSIDKLLQVVNG